MKSGSDNIFEDLGFSGERSIELQFKAELYVILKKTVAQQELTGKQLEKLWNLPPSKVSDVVTGRLDKVSVTRLLHFLSALGVKIRPVRAA